MRKSHLLLPLASVVLAVACRQTLPEDRLVDLLTDMYLYDEDLAKGIQGADSVSVYRSVFVQHGCSEDEYKKTIAYYAKKPKVMKEIYEAVKARLEGYKAVFEHAAQLEDYMRDATVSSYDTLFYIALDGDSTRRVYLPKFRTQLEATDSLLIVIPERPDESRQFEPSGQPGQVALPEQPEQLKPRKLPAQFDKPVRLERDLRRPARSMRPIQPVKELQSEP